MRWLEFGTDNCSVQRSLEVVGEKWTMIVLREVFNGVRRFDQIRRHTGISEPILTGRLRKLVEGEILVTVPYQEEGRRTRYEYRLTDKGRDLYPILIALLQWGDRYRADEPGPSVTVTHRDCGAQVEAIVSCGEGHGPLRPAEVEAGPGPAAVRL